MPPGTSHGGRFDYTVPAPARTWVRPAAPDPQACHRKEGHTTPPKATVPTDPGSPVRRHSTLSPHPDADDTNTALRLGRSQPVLSKSPVSPASRADPRPAIYRHGCTMSGAVLFRCREGSNVCSLVGIQYLEYIMLINLVGNSDVCSSLTPGDFSAMKRPYGSCRLGCSTFLRFRGTASCLPG